jgi:hypothetical protein
MGKKGNNSKSQRGQASLIMAMMLSTVILLFFFVINVGVLVHAKINLQNAADMAAYAGAASQARQLTHISYLNYEMRRQFKKFLFRYYVFGTRATKPHQTRSPDSGPVEWNFPTPSPDMGVPAVCLSVNPNENWCQIAAQPQIAIPPSAGSDMLQNTLIQNLEKLEKQRAESCLVLNTINLYVLTHWAFNPSATSHMPANAGATGRLSEVIDVMNKVSSATSGLGLIPRNIILQKRIETLQGYVNQAGKNGVTFASVRELQGGIPDPVQNERTINAFLSAYYTLGERTFGGENDDQIIMDELLPQGSTGANLLNLETLILDHFDTYYLTFTADAADPNKDTSCKSAVAPLSFRDIPVGVRKNSDALTYYAVRLRAKARLLFSPFGDVSMTAYSAAKPFGSRIGPPMAGLSVNAAARSLFFYEKKPNLAAPMDNWDATGIPNLPVGKEDTTSNGWAQKEVLTAFDRIIEEATTYDTAAFESFYELAMAPNPWEAGRYNILHDQPGDQGVYSPRSFPSQGRGTASSDYYLWAPIIAPSEMGSPDQIAEKIRERLETSLSGISDTVGGQGVDNLKEVLVDRLQTYIMNLSSGTSMAEMDEDETFNVVRLRNPLSFPEGQSTGGVILTNPNELRSSYAPPNLAREGRVGYSVKFITLNSLINPSRRTVTGGSNALNTPSDSQLRSVLQQNLNH